MSYTIERHKRVLELKTDDKRFGRPDTVTLLFVASSSCNNISPHRFDWNVLAWRQYSVWNGNIIVPSTIWLLGEAADGGGIKPWGKEVTGVGYVKAWKQAVKERTPIDGWTPRVSIWIEEDKGRAEEIDNTGLGLFGGPSNYCKVTYGPPLYEAFRRLFPKPRGRAGAHSAYVSSPAELLDAVYLFQHRDQLPFSLYVNDSEHTAFFRKGPTLGEAVPA